MNSLKLSIMMLILCISSCKTVTKNNNQESLKKIPEMKVSNKEKAVALLRSLETGAKEPVGYINPTKYIQHNLAVGDGLIGFGNVLKHAPERGFKANVIRAFQDGNYVFTHTIYDFFGPKVGFDIFRFENDLIVEHWDNLAEITPLNPSGHSQTDGASTVTDLNKTEENKIKVKNFIETILVRGEMDKIQNFIDADNYIQHNSNIADGLSGLGSALETLAKQGVYMEYKTLHKVLGEGNFILTISEGKFGGKETSFYDLFRVDNGKIVEHWDTIETIIPKSEWKNNNGKFNF